MPEETRLEIQKLDKLEGRKALADGWLTLFYFFVLLAAIFASLVGFIALGFEVGTLGLLGLFCGILFWIVAAIASKNRGRLASGTGNKILARHPDERFFKYRFRAVFAKRMGKLTNRIWLLSLFCLLLFILIGLSLL